MPTNRTMQTFLRIPALVSASLLLTTAVHAGDLTVTIDATVFSNSLGGSLAGAAAGDAVVISFEVSASGTVISPGQYSTYAVDIPTFQVMAGGGTVTATSGSMQLGIYDDFPVSDGATIGYTPIGGGYAFEMSASDSSGAMFSSVDLGALVGTYTGVQFNSVNYAALSDGGTALDLTLDAIAIAPIVSVPVLGCTPANPHYLGGSVTLAGSAFGLAGGSGLHIDAAGGPPSEFGFVIMSSDGSASTNLFQGVLCLGTPQGRYNPQVATNQGLPQLNSLGQFDGAGVFQNLVGTSVAGSGFDVPSELPFSPAGQTIASGDTYFFQVWYRDQDGGGGPSANFSDTIEATFP